MEWLEDDIDYAAYQSTEDHNTVIAASSLRDKVVDLFYGDAANAGVDLPFSSTRGILKLRPAEVTVWTGYKGHGKSTLLDQVLLNGLQHGEKELDLSMEFLPEMLLKRKLRQCAGCPEPTIRYIDDWHRWTDGRLWMYAKQGSVTPEKVLGIIRYAVEKFGVTQVLVDSLMKCGIPPKDIDAQKQFVDDLQTIAHQMGPHIHLVAHAKKDNDHGDRKPAQLHDVKGASEICDMVENVFSVWRNKDKKEESQPDAMLICEAQRNGNGELPAVPLWFDPYSTQFFEYSRNFRPVDYSGWGGTNG